MTKEEKLARKQQRKAEKVGLGKLLLWNSSSCSVALSTLMLGYVTFYCTDVLQLAPALVGTLFILMRSFFASIPNELFESATIDGCSPFGCFWRIMLPLSKPALASVGLFIAVGLWNEYMHFILYITDPNWQNFQVKVRSLILEDGLSGTAITLSADMLKSATVVVVVLPFLFIYPFIQKYFTKGVTLGAVKG